MRLQIRYLQVGNLGLVGNAGVVESAAHDGFVNVDVAVADLEVETTFRIGAYPSFVVNSGSLTAKI